jgi:hypothetical protein
VLEMGAHGGRVEPLEGQISHASPA